MTNNPFRRPASTDHTSNDRRCGAATVEFVLTLPIAFLLFFGSIEMTRLNSVRNTADNAAYEGARRAILPGANKDSVDKEALSILDAGSIRHATITMEPATIDSSTERVTVTVAVNMNRNSWVAPVYSKDLTIRQSCTLSREQALSTGTSAVSSGNNGNGGNGRRGG